VSAAPSASSRASSAVTAEAMLEALQRWRHAGQLRALDLAFARLLHELDAEAPASLLLAAALAAQMEGRGHDCIELSQLTRAHAAAVLGWTSPSADELLALLPDWDAARAAWAASPLVELDPTAVRGRAAAPAGPSAPGKARSPLVLHRQRLYLRRYWTWESRVAAHVLARTAAAPQAEAVDAAAARRWLDQLFPPSPSRAADSRNAPPATAEKASPKVAANANPSRRGTAQSAKGVEPPLDGQKLACALALQGRFTVITGGPGTGKTYTAARLLVLLQALHRGRHPLRVALAAPTGKAAARLRQAIDGALAQLRPTVTRDLFEHDPTAPPGAARTLHALLGARPGTRRFRHDASRPLEVDVLFVDEASMVHLEMMDALLDALPPRARLVLLGDKDQLASVEAGAVLGDLCAGAGADAYTAATRRHVHAVSGITLPARGARGPDGDRGEGRRGDHEALAQHVAILHTSHRFSGAIGELAAAVNRGDAAAVHARLAAGTDASVAHAPDARDGDALCRLAIEGRDGVAPGYRHCFERLRDRPGDPSAFDAWALAVLTAFDRLRVLCAVREGPQGVAAVNEAIERALAGAGLLPARRGEWYEGRPVMVTRNDPGLGVFNGDIGLALRPPGRTPGSAPDAAAQALRVYFLDAGTLRSVSSTRLADVETAFALTVHKSQGSEFEHVVLLLPGEDVPVLTRELLYTAITRAKAAFTLAGDPQRVEGAVRRLTRRGSGLRELLDGSADAGPDDTRAKDAGSADAGRGGADREDAG